VQRSLGNVWSVVVIGLVVSLGAASQGSAQTYHSLSVSLLGGVGGSPDVEDSDFGNRTLQLAIGVPTELGTSVTLRVGRFETDEAADFGGFGGATFDYATLAGDYQFHEPAFDSSLFFGLGAYRLEGLVNGVVDDEVVAGLTFGVGADFPISKKVSLALEVAGHWADFDDAQIFATAMGGLTFRF
jgi:hypothetical protein